MGGPPSWWLGKEANNSSLQKKISLLGNATQGLLHTKTAFFLRVRD